jgi:hypothetical protein
VASETIEKPGDGRVSFAQRRIAGLIYFLLGSLRFAPFAQRLFFNPEFYGFGFCDCLK